MSLTKWSLDPTHSEVIFKIKHLMISTVTGQFNKFTWQVKQKLMILIPRKKLNSLPILILLIPITNNAMRI